MIDPDLALYLGIVLTFVAFARLEGPKALILSFVIGWLVLPANWAINLLHVPALKRFHKKYLLLTTNGLSGIYS